MGLGVFAYTISLMLILI